jgi:hypothetical protein
VAQSIFITHSYSMGYVYRDKPVAQALLLA